jgi:hypothetical protein
MSGALALITASALVTVASVILTALLRPDGVADAIVTVGLVASAAVAVLVAATGMAHTLDPGGLVTGAVVLSAAAIAVAGVDGSSGAMRGAVKCMRTASMAVVQACRHDRWLAVLALSAAAAVAWVAFIALVLPPYAFDALTYHLTTVAWWVQHHSLARNSLSDCCSSYPLNAELQLAWPVALLGRDALVDLVQIPFAVLGAAAVAGIARSAGVTRRAALAAGAIFVATPIVLTQSSTAYVDVIVAGWALAATHALVRFRATGEPRRLVCAFVAAGLLVGTKGVAPVWGVVIVGVGVVVAIAAARRERARVASIARACAIGAVVVVALGSLWYVRNWVDFGNPLEPFEVKVAGVTLFDGPRSLDDILTTPGGAADDSPLVPIGRSWAADVTFWDRGPYDYQTRSGGLGPLWACLGVPALAAATVSLWRHRSPAVLAVVLTAAVFAVQPYRWWSRFTIPLAALGAVAVAMWASSERVLLRRGVRVAALGLALAGIALSTYKVDPAGRATPLRGDHILRLAVHRDEPRSVGALFFHEYAFVDEIPSEATVVVDLSAPQVRFVYPLFGRSLSRHVQALHGSPPASAWVVTGTDRPVDRALERDTHFILISERRGVRVWRPATGAG